jgi:hypothetical protein
MHTLHLPSCLSNRSPIAHLLLGSLFYLLTALSEGLFVVSAMIGYRALLPAFQIVGSGG